MAFCTGCSLPPLDSDAHRRNAQRPVFGYRIGSGFVCSFGLRIRTCISIGHRAISALRRRSAMRIRQTRIFRSSIRELARCAMALRIRRPMHSALTRTFRRCMRFRLGKVQRHRGKRRNLCVDSFIFPPAFLNFFQSHVFRYEKCMITFPPHAVDKLFEPLHEFFIV